jgi:hypothetical protein
VQQVEVTEREMICIFFSESSFKKEEVDILPPKSMSIPDKHIVHSEKEHTTNEVVELKLRRRNDGCRLVMFLSAKKETRSKKFSRGDCIRL